MVKISLNQVEEYFKEETKDFMKFDGGKPRMELLPPEAMFALAQVLTFGAEKYADNNWRKADDVNRYIGAALRHIFQHQAGEVTDPESGLPHMHHALANLAFIVSLQGE